MVGGGWELGFRAFLLESGSSCCPTDMEKEFWKFMVIEQQNFSPQALRTKKSPRVSRTSPFPRQKSPPQHPQWDPASPCLAPLGPSPLGWKACSLPAGLPSAWEQGLPQAELGPAP